MVWVSGSRRARGSRGADGRLRPRTWGAGDLPGGEVVLSLADVRVFNQVRRHYSGQRDTTRTTGGTTRQPELILELKVEVEGWRSAVARSTGSANGRNLRGNRNGTGERVPLFVRQYAQVKRGCSD